MWISFAIPSIGLSLVILGSIVASRGDFSPRNSDSLLELFRRDGNSGDQPKCPPCFNCQLPVNQCYNSGVCNSFNGRCECLPGFGGDDCTAPLCGGLSDGLDRKPRPDDQKDCKCKDGWSGINCNMCQTNSACDPFIPEGRNGTCYKGGIVMKESQQMCQVTNKRIVQLVVGGPEVTFSCNRTSAACSFQFWAGKVESFSCSLSKCKYEDLDNPPSPGDEIGQTCEEISCSCIPERYLCNSNFINIGESLLGIKGPGKFTCESNRNCKFSEPTLDGIIQKLTGDKQITLSCQSGECMHYSQVPGYSHPIRPISWVFLKIAGVSLAVFLVSLIMFWLFCNFKQDSGYMPIEWEDESGKLMTHHQPATLSFKEIHYHVGDSDVLSGVSGLVKPGEIMAIMGASGAGKTSFLDILARRNKAGTVSGDICINGRILSNKEFKKLVGYVDQEDTLMPTLTVYETVLNSALLRLPSDMSFEAKRLRVVECLSELGILGIKDSRIGSSGKRGISGGEKRRVSIACELVTSPAILFLDEPTSGLDAFNAQAVVDCLVTLAKNFRRTIVFTIHQPRSDIYAKFDRLVFLSQGWPLFSGPASLASPHFASLGHPCPPGYNIADFLIDLAQEPRWPDIQITEEAPGDLWDEELPASLQDSSIQPFLINFVLGFKRSPVAIQLQEDFIYLDESAQESPDHLQLGYRRPSWWTQFRILSRRAFINLYRDPILMLANYGISLTMAGLCGYLYFQVADDIKGVQNRIGLFFFICSLFGFSCLTSLQAFHPERILFMRERANGYYHPIVYFFAKILFDLVPLRVIPPLLLGVVIYPLVGLNPSLTHFGIFLASLVLFNLTVASFCLLLGIVIKDLSLSNLLASVMMLMSMILTGPFLHLSDTKQEWIQDLSFFHTALEAMLSNEMRSLEIHDNKYGMIINIPVAPVLEVLGFNASRVTENIKRLSFSLLAYLVLAYLALHFLVKEKR